MKFWNITSFAILLSLSANSCYEKTEENKAEEVVNAYATAYFNWDFPSAANYANASGKQWLIFLSSQVKEADIEALREKETAAEVEVGDIELRHADTEAVITVDVTNFLAMDSIGKKPHICNSAQYTIKAVKENTEWRFGKPEICQ